MKKLSAIDLKTATHFDLLILGSGSAAFAAAIKAAELGKSVGIIEERTLGGTCLNVGCVPSKTLIRAAEAKHRIEHTNFKGITPQKTEIDFAKLIREKDSLVSELRGAKYQSVIDANPKIKVINGRGKFLDLNTIEVDNKRFTGGKILIATGGSPLIPEILGLKDVGFLTSTSAFELKELPQHLIVLGGGYIALEISQMFARLGSKVTIVQRSEILSSEDPDISQALAGYLVSEGIDVINQNKIHSISRNNSGVRVDLVRNGEKLCLKADQILVAVGRKPNTSGVGLEAAGVKLNHQGYIDVNSYCQTSQANIYAAGDVLESPALVYVAAYEGNLASENAFLGNVRKADYQVVPWVIFSDPQVSGVGLNETQAKALGIKYDLSVLTFDNVPRALAARDTRGFIKLLRKSGSQELIGARVLAPEGSELIMELSLILKYKIPLNEVASMFHPYLTQSEAVKLAIQTFDKSVKTLSCCAS